jgi:hypothetical protein
MFCTQEDVIEYTGYSVTGAVIQQAQAIVESYIGRLEDDISDPRDYEILKKATAYQAAYMKDNYNKVFQQVAMKQVTQNGGIITFKDGDEVPFVAPLTAMACKSLSWRKSRNVAIGPIQRLRYWRRY